MIKCIAIDDEPKALEVIKNHVSKIDYLSLLNVFTDPFKAITFIETTPVDLIFLDINMPDIDGIKFLTHLKTKTQIIFTTAHSEYALHSYEVEAVDYLLKPFDFSRFLTAVVKAKERISINTLQEDYFFVSTGTQKKRLLYKDILYIQAEGNYVMYHTLTDRTMVRASISETVELLPRNKFVQIHRSTIVSLHSIDKVEDNHVHIQNEKHQISSTYRDAFLMLINRKK
ncbi:MAG: response regulator transcription factor [Bacteroidia bacterium]|nr:response regulator transcription factor [Bacteroidia bacterium]